MGKMALPILFGIFLLSGLGLSDAFAQQGGPPTDAGPSGGLIADLQTQVDSNTASIDSFFDIFTEIANLFNVDSFFDVFVELKSTDEDLQDQLNTIELTPGPAGTDGINCWDLNENNSADFPEEDTNGDSSINVEDCRGVDGESGTSCTVTQNDGSATISCEDGTTAVVNDGQDGTSTEVSVLESKINFLERYFGLDGIVRTDTGGVLEPIIIEATASIIWEPRFVIEDSGKECTDWTGGIFSDRECIRWHYWRSGYIEWIETRDGEITDVTNSPQTVWVNSLDSFDLTVSGNEQNDVLLAILFSDESKTSLAQGTQSISPTSSGESQVTFDGPDMIFENIQANIDAPQPSERSAGCNSSVPCSVDLPSPVIYSDTGLVTITIEVTP